MATTEDLTKVKNLLSNTDVIESCTREGTNTKRKFHKLTKNTFFAALLKEVPKGCKDTVFADPSLQNHSVKCLTFEEKTWKPYKDNLCLFRALALHLHGKERLESETSKLFNLFFEKTDGTDHAIFRGVCREKFAKVENIVQADIFLYDIDIVDGSMIGELARRSVGKYSNAKRLLRYISHVCYAANINALFKANRCPSCDQFIKTV